jgi:hypothetical protein
MERSLWLRYRQAVCLRRPGQAALDRMPLEVVATTILD